MMKRSFLESQVLHPHRKQLPNQGDWFVFNFPYLGNSLVRPLQFEDDDDDLPAPTSKPAKATAPVAAAPSAKKGASLFDDEDDDDPVPAAKPATKAPVAEAPKSAAAKKPALLDDDDDDGWNCGIEYSLSNLGLPRPVWWLQQEENTCREEFESIST